MPLIAKIMRNTILANEILKGTDLSVKDRVQIVSAISNHDESTGGAKFKLTANGSKVL